MFSHIYTENENTDAVLMLARSKFDLEEYEPRIIRLSEIGYKPEAIKELIRLIQRESRINKQVLLILNDTGEASEGVLKYLDRFFHKTNQKVDADVSFTLIQLDESIRRNTITL